MSTERERERLLDEVAKKIKRETDCKSSHMGRRQLLGPSGILNTITPCAACKLLRRRCAEECPFSPYFSPHEPHKFAAVHKVFGASNVSKMIMDVEENQRADAVNSLVFEANLRLRDPVYGCMGVISALQHQVQSLQTEINAVRDEILKYKYREAAAASTIISSSTHHAALVSNSDSDSILAVALPVSLPPPPLLLPPPTPSVVSSTSPPSSASSLYTVLPSSTTGYSSITSDHNIPYYE